MIGHSLRSHGAHNGFKTSTCADNELRRQYVPGDIAWMKSHGSSWWPTQVIDEKSLVVKPKKKMKDDILVRLYGSHKYLYVNPLKFIEFENIANQESINVKEEFQKALEKDLSYIISRGNSNGKVSEFKENPMAESPRGIQTQTGSAVNLKAVASPSTVSSFSEPYETRMEGEKNHVMKHESVRYTEADEDGVQISNPTVKVRPDVSEASGNKQGETHSNKKQRNLASRIRTKDQDILRRSPRNKAKEDKLVMNHAAAGYTEEDDEDEAHKSRATEKIRADASEASGNKHGETHGNKRKQKNGISRTKTMNQDSLIQSSHEEAMEDVNLNPSKTQTAEKHVLEIPNLMQKGNAANSEFTYSREFLAVPKAEENVMSKASEQKNAKQSEMASLENRTSKGKDSRQVMLKKRKLNVHEVAKRLVILELAKLRGTVNCESETNELKERAGKGDIEVKRSKQNDLTELKYKEVGEQSAQSVTDRFSKQKKVMQRETKGQSVNEAIDGTSKDKFVRRDGSNHSKHEKLKNTQSPCITSHHLPEELEDVSARKTRVMRNLGLIAPSGSPFRRSGSVQA